MSFLLDTTLASNLRLGKVTASDAELEEVVKHVGIADWVGALHGGLTHKVGPGGSPLSGGQRQRLGLGRTILQRPRILILDEATSSLDAASEQQLLSNLHNFLPGSTIIEICQCALASAVFSHNGHMLACPNVQPGKPPGQIVDNPEIG